MTKAEIVAAVAANTGNSQDEVEAVVDGVIGEITSTLAADEAVDLGPLGRFIPRAEAAHEGTNPQTHEPMQIEAQTRVLFHPSSALRAAVNPQIA